MALASVKAPQNTQLNVTDDDPLESPDTLACGIIGPNSLEASLTLPKSSQMLWHCCRGGR